LKHPKNLQRLRGRMELIDTLGRRKEKKSRKVEESQGWHVAVVRDGDLGSPKYKHGWGAKELSETLRGEKQKRM